ncbi:MAG: hypothetical protein ACOYNO_01500 [Saprospiraceae bacterium]
MDSTAFDHHLPNDNLADLLVSGNFEDIQHVYRECRQPILRSLEEAGCPDDEAGVFFRTALIEAAGLIANDQAPPQMPFAFWLKGLAKAHYFDRQQEQISGDNAPETDFEASDIPVPEAAERLEHRKKMFVWSKLAAMSAPCIDELAGTELEWPTKTDCEKAFLERLRLPEQETPAWVNNALTDVAGWQLYQTTASVERLTPTTNPVQQKSNNIIWWLWLGFFLFALSIFLYYTFFTTTKAKDAFEGNFEPPKSLLSDIRDRYGPARGNDSIGARPADCDQLLETADRAYTRKAFDEAKDALLLIVIENESVCASDAWLYLAVISLEEKDPVTALESLSKIQDLEYFGEDIYWYQALAFVQLAAESSTMNSKAKGALNRFLDTSKDEVRRTKALEMMEAIGD